MSILKRRPDRPPAAGPNDPRYWDSIDLEDELKRVFQICHECRMCIGYCGTFPSLLGAIDRDIDSRRAEGAEKLTAQDFVRASDLCWQCKLCYIKCPYTEDEGATELVDFPRLMAREKAQRSRREGVPVVDKVLGEPGLIGKLGGGAMAPITNFVNQSRLMRKIGEAVTGISAKFPLPPVASQAFPSWMASHQPAPGAGESGEVILFATCYGDYNQTSVSRAAVRVLEHQGYRVLRPKGEVCCGMPNLDGGDVDAMIKKVRANVEILLPHVEAGKKIVVPAPTCSYTMRKEWPLYVDSPDVRAVSAATLDLMQFLDLLRKAKTLKKDFKKPLGPVTYHAACHLRAQKIAFPGMRVLSQIPGTDVRMVEQCSAVDGTWGMKAAFYEMGRKYAQKLVSAVEEDEPSAQGQRALVVTDCPLSALRIVHETGRRVLHPVEAVSEAYGLSAEDRSEDHANDHADEHTRGHTRDQTEGGSR
jgi:glycerol-3-phosphate dehydrogenase subunit C